MDFSVKAVSDLTVHLQPKSFFCNPDMCFVSPWIETVNFAILHCLIAHLPVHTVQLEMKHMSV
jgi:hypothetical protein